MTLLIRRAMCTINVEISLKAFTYMRCLKSILPIPITLCQNVQTTFIAYMNVTSDALRTH